MRISIVTALFASLWTSNSVALDCTGLPEWRRQHYYLQGDQVQYQAKAYENGAGQTHGLLGYMLWAAECPSSRNICTTLDNDCKDGMGAGATYFDIQPLDFSALRPD